MCYIGMCSSKGYASSAVLVINRVSILAILIIKLIGSGVCSLVLNWACFLKEVTVLFNHY